MNRQEEGHENKPLGSSEHHEKVRQPMHHLKRSMLVCMLAIVLTTLLTAGVAQAAGLSGKKWSIVKSPNGTRLSANILDGVAAISATDIWAVGYDYASRPRVHTLIEQWNGSNWQIIPSPNAIGSYANYLNGVAAISATDIWTVGGYYKSSDFINHTLIEHWDGTNWQVIPSPGPTFGATLFGVAAISATDIWAVGYDYKSSGPANQTLIEHWNGTRWQVVSSPNVPGSSANILQGVAAVSAANIWAVGYYTNSSGINQTLIEHWNGSNWQTVASPSSGSSNNQLYGVTVVSASNIWAVGFYTNGNGTDQTLIEHWNGTNWQVVSSPNAGPYSNDLYGVAAVSATNIWTVGDFDSVSGGLAKTLTEFYG